jgi:hypothetical protein
MEAGDGCRHRGSIVADCPTWNVPLTRPALPILFRGGCPDCFLDILRCGFRLGAAKLTDRKCYSSWRYWHNHPRSWNPFLRWPRAEGFVETTLNILRKCRGVVLRLISQFPSFSWLRSFSEVGMATRHPTVGEAGGTPALVQHWWRGRYQLPISAGFGFGVVIFSESHKNVQVVYSRFSRSDSTCRIDWRTCRATSNRTFLLLQGLRINCLAHKI